MQRLLGIATALTALLVLVPASSTLAAETPTELELNDAIRLRKEFGLQSSRALVEDSFTDRAKFSDMSWGVPLTKPEAEDLNQRVHRVRTVTAAVQAASKRDGYAGVYYDQLRGGVPVFLFSKDRDAAAAEVRSIVDGATAVEVKKVQRSKERLRDLQRSVVGERGRLNQEGVLVTAVGLDIRGNVVEVGVQGSVDKARTLLEGYGDAVHVVQEDVAQWDCSGANDCPKAKGGIRLNGSDSYCTSGFMGKRVDGSDHLVLLTAGHCWQFAQSGGNTSWKHSGDTVGWNEARVWNSSSNAPYPTIPTDAGIIDLKADFEPTTNNRNKLLMTHTNPTVGRVDRWASSFTAHSVGTPVCRFGAGSANSGNFSARKCGTISKHAVTKLSCKGPGVTPPCANVENTMKVSFDSTGGDSGGPYWMGDAQTNPPVKAMGLHVHSDVDGTSGAKGWYTPIHMATHGLFTEKGVSMHVCLANDC